jgi:hypothetical protein
MRRLFTLVILLWLAQDVRATVLLPAEFREVVAGSEIIVYGRVADVRPEWSDDRSRIDTVVSLDAGTFRVPGGQIGRYKNVMVGAPEFRVGEEVVLFLSAAGPSIAHVFGLNQGVYRVRVDARTGRRLVVPPVLTASSDAPQAVIRGDQSRQPLPLDSFAASVRSAMARTGGVR